MRTVGIRDLKNGLSRYLKLVRNGETIVVTERGEPVARIVPAGIPEGAARLIAEGRAKWSGRRPSIPNRIKLRDGAPLASDLVIEDRG